jgi:hypothetical protein
MLREDEQRTRTSEVGRIFHILGQMLRKALERIGKVENEQGHVMD